MSLTQLMTPPRDIIARFHDNPHEYLYRLLMLARLSRFLINYTGINTSGHRYTQDQVAYYLVLDTPRDNISVPDHLQELIYLGTEIHLETISRFLLIYTNITGSMITDTIPLATISWLYYYLLSTRTSSG